MSYYETPEAMYIARGEQFKKSGDRYWALAKSGAGEQYYGKAKFCYNQAAENQKRAENARKSNATWGK